MREIHLKIFINNCPTTFTNGCCSKYSYFNFRQWGFLSTNSSSRHFCFSFYLLTTHLLYLEPSHWTKLSIIRNCLILNNFSLLFHSSAINMLNTDRLERTNLLIVIIPLSDSSALCHTDYTSEHAVYTICILHIATFNNFDDDRWW